MSRWEPVDQTEIPNGGGELRLFRREDEFAIRIAGGQGDLMNSRTHGSEDALGTLVADPLSRTPGARVLIGGLGMGFTLSAALKCLREDARITVAELVPGVVVWNQGMLGDCADRPLDDSRVEVETLDVGELISRGTGAWDAIILDVDNGPEGLTHKDNDRLYEFSGLQMAYTALKPGGVLAVWSAFPSKRFSKRLKSVGFHVEERRVRAHRGKGSRHVIWLARRATSQ